MLSPTASRTTSVSISSRSEHYAVRAGLPALVPGLRIRAMHLTRDAALAEDLVQDTVERALRFEAQYACDSTLRAWLMTILFSIFVTRFRRVRRELRAMRVLAHDPNAWTLPEPHKPEAHAPLTRRTSASLDALPPGFRQAIELVDIEGHTYRDAAGELGVPVGTVMSRLHRGRRMLKESLATA